jgi:uncharacterized membrane protein
MKHNSILALLFLAVLTATILLPISAATACVALTITGVLTMLVSDYSHELRPLQARAEVIAGNFAGRHAAELNKAA